jgi:3-phosphoglycerate kinase
VVSDESVATELAMQHAMDAVQQLLDAGAGTITVVGTHSSFANESFKPLANALSESLDRPVRFVDSDEKAMGIITEFEGKREAKAKARAARELRIAEKAAAAEVRRQARLEAGGNADEDEDDEDEDEEDEDEDEDDEDEEGNCPIIVLENRSLMKPEQVAYRTELHALAEEEDIAERNREMDSYLATLEEMCDIFVNNDMAGSGRTDVTVSGVKARLNLYVAGPRLQQELTIMEQVVEKVPRPAFGIVGGKSLRDNVVILNSLIDKLDEIMLGAHLSPLFERVMRERFFAANPEAATIGIASDPINVPDVGAVVAGDATTDISSTAADIAAVNTKAYSTGEFVVLTPDEDALLPVVRYLVSKAVGKGVRIHTAQDYTIGNLPPTSRDDGGFEMEYAGEVSEFIVTPLISGSAETADDAVGIENGRAGGAEEEDGDEDEEEDDELEDGEAKLAPDDPRVVRASFGMPASNVHVLDIGPSTQEAWAQALSGVKSVLWIGALGAVEYQDFCAGSQAVLDALMPEDGEGDADETDADQTAGDGGVAMPWVKPTVTLVGERLVGALRAAGMADEDLTLVSSCSVETVTDLVCGELSGLARLAEMAEAEPEAEQEPREAKLSDS